MSSMVRISIHELRCSITYCAACLLYFIIITCHTTALAQTSIVGTSSTRGDSIAYALGGRGSQVLVSPIGTLPANRRVGSLFGHFASSHRQSLLQVRRIGARRFAFFSVSSNATRVVRTITLSASIGSSYYLVTGFDVNQDGLHDVAIVDTSAHHYRWFVVVDPLKETIREHSSFRLGFQGDSIDWVSPSAREVQFAAVRHTKDTPRVRVLLRSATTGQIQIHRARWKNALGMLYSIRLHRDQQSTLPLALYSPSTQRLLVFRTARYLKTLDLPQQRCGGLQAITDVTSKRAVVTLEVCPDSSFVSARRENLGSTSDIILSLGTLPERIAGLRRGDITEITASGEESPLFVPTPSTNSTTPPIPDPVPATPTSVPEISPTNPPVAAPTPPPTDHRHSGAGTATNPYVISRIEQWLSLAATATDYDKYFVLDADLDFATIPGEDPIIGGAGSPAFTGVFDGRGHTISNWEHLAPTSDYVAPFGQLSGGTVQNLNISAVNAGGKTYVGGVAGLASSSFLYRVSSSGAVTCTSERAGGLVGHSSSANIEQSSSSATVSGPAKIGGLIGRSHASDIHHAFATGTVSGQANTGGLVGEFTWEGRLTNSFATGDVNGSGGAQIGGLVGYCESCNWVEFTFSSGSVTGDSATGGLIGRNTGTVRNSFTVSNVYGLGANIGPVVGLGSGITNVYATSAATCDANRGTIGVQPCNSTATAFHAAISDFHGFANQPVSTWDRVGTSTDGRDDSWIVSSEALPRLAFTSPSVDVAPWAGDGTTASPYLISSTNDWNAIGSNPRWMQSHFRLTADLSFAGLTYNRVAKDSTFFGSIDGDGHSISDVTQTTTTVKTALIDKVARGATISNLSTANINFSTPFDGAILVGSLGGSVANCRIRGTITGNSGLGGIASTVRGGSVTKSTFNGTVMAAGQSNSGGIAARVTAGGLIDQCRVEGSIRGGNDYNGALVGALSGGTVQNCYSTAAMAGGDDYTGGLVGVISAGSKLLNSYVAGSVTGQNDKTVGGLVGMNSGLVQDSFVTADITAKFGTSVETGVLFSVNNGESARNYFWSGLLCDADSSSAGIQLCNVNGAAGSYQDLSALYSKMAPPMDAWDFDTVWQENQYGLPTLRFEGL